MSVTEVNDCDLLLERTVMLKDEDIYLCLGARVIPRDDEMGMLHTV